MTNKKKISFLVRAVEIARNFSIQRYCYLEAEKNTVAKGRLFTTIRSNYFDIAVLDWMLLFGNRDDPHHFKKLITDSASFKRDLLLKLNFNESEWTTYRDELKKFRDKRVAHFEQNTDVIVPSLDKALVCVSEYYKALIEESNNIDANATRAYDPSIESYLKKNAPYFSTGLSKAFGTFSQDHSKQTDSSTEYP